MKLRRSRRVAPEPPAPAGGWERLESRALALCHPEWRGVRTAAYSYRVPMIESADCTPFAAALAESIAGAGVEVLVVHGFPPGSPELLRAARTVGVETRLVLHSSPTQHGAEAGEARVAEQALALLGDGTVGRLGFAKEGVAEAFQALGYDTAWVPNRVPVLPPFDRLELRPPGLHVGVFAEPFWRKNVVPQVQAAVLLGADGIHVMRRPDVAYLARAPLVEHGELPWEEFVRVQGSVDLNLYVTLSECQPLTPVESYAAGVPCLASRTSALFRDDPDLWDLTTIDELDNPRAIAVAARRLLDHRDDAVAAAHGSLARHDRRAAELWDEFSS